MLATSTQILCYESGCREHRETGPADQARFLNRQRALLGRPREGKDPRCLLRGVFDAATVLRGFVRSAMGADIRRETPRDLCFWRGALNARARFARFLKELYF